MEWETTALGGDLRVAALPCGTPVLWVPAEGQTTARLTFRVGVVDEALTSRGTTHLVEHLAHTRVGLPLYGCNASVTARRTAFDVRGTAEEVSTHLVAVTEALADLPTERLEQEVAVLRLEADRRAPDLWDPLRTTRHGLRGWGLFAADELGLHGIDAERVRAWARRFFTAQNAVLWVHGPEPIRLDLSLPQGRAVSEPPVHDLPQTTPAWFSGRADTVAFSAVGDDDPALLAGWWWLHRSLRQRLRTQDGAVYDVDASVQAMTGERFEWTMAARTTPERAAGVLRAVQEVTSAVCREDVPLAELEAWRSAHLEGLATDVLSTAPAATEPLPADAALQLLDVVARALLDAGARAAGSSAARSGAGIAIVDVVDDLVAKQREEVTRTRGLQPADVRQALVEAFGTALLQVPWGVDGPSGVPAVGALSPRGVSGGRTFVAARHLEGGQRLVVSAMGVMVEPAPAAHVTVLWSQCVAVLRHRDGRRVVIGDDASVVDVDPAEWTHARAAVAAVDAFAPPLVVIDVDGPPEAFRLPPRKLSGLASMSTGALVALLIGAGLFTWFVLSVALQPGASGFAWTLAALCAAASVGLGAALVQRLRAARHERTTLDTRARTHVAVAVDQALARGSRVTARNLAIGGWALTAACLLVSAWHGVAFWPAMLPAAFALRASREATRRTLR